VGFWYDDFSQAPEHEIRELLERVVPLPAT